jgi:hypothetical protein
MNEITQASYLEHLRRRDELARYLPIDHPKRIKVEASINEMINETK